MKKKALIISVMLLMMTLIVGLVVSIQKKQEESRIEGIIEDSQGGSTFVKLEEARKQAAKIAENSENYTFRNMELKKFKPIVTEEDTISNLLIYAPHLPETKTADIINSKVDILRNFFGEDMDLNYIRNIEGKTIEETIGMVENEVYGEDYDFNDILMIYDKGEEFGYIDAIEHLLWIDKGIEGVVVGEEQLLDITYYANALDGSLDDVYMTSTGEMSVKEAIQEVEAYFNEKFPLELDKDIEYRVIKVWILNLGNEIYAFNFGMHRYYKGIPFEYATSGVSGYGVNDALDMIDVVLEGKDKVAFLNGFTYNNEFEENESYDKILSPEKALEYVSEQIGEASVYEVFGMELSYTARYEDGYSSAKPVWIISTKNKTTEAETRFYVDVKTGKVTTRVMK